MSKTLTKEQLIRAAWLVELRRQGHRQCIGSSFGPNNTVCALSLLGEIAGCKYEYLGRIGRQAGLNGKQVGDIVKMNDGFDWSFAQIADVVEGWFR